MMILNLGERGHFETLNTLKKVQILISRSFEKLSFSYRSIVKHFKKERENFVTTNDISKYANLFMIIPNLGER